MTREPHSWSSAGWGLCVPAVGEAPGPPVGPVGNLCVGLPVSPEPKALESSCLNAAPGRGGAPRPRSLQTGSTTLTPGQARGLCNVGVCTHMSSNVEEIACAQPRLPSGDVLGDCSRTGHLNAVCPPCSAPDSTHKCVPCGFLLQVSVLSGQIPHTEKSPLTLSGETCCGLGR